MNRKAKGCDLLGEFNNKLASSVDGGDAEGFDAFSTFAHYRVGDGSAR